MRLWNNIQYINLQNYSEKNIDTYIFKKKIYQFTESYINFTGKFHIFNLYYDENWCTIGYIVIN